MLCRHIGIIQRGELVANSSMRDLLAKSQSETIIIDYVPTAILTNLKKSYKLLLIKVVTMACHAN
jgi:ABC-type multidrug transport system, ATPase component